MEISLNAKTVVMKVLLILISVVGTVMMNLHYRRNVKMDEKTRQRFKEMSKNWYEQNKERIKEENKERHLMNKERENDLCKIWYANNREYRKERMRLYYTINKDKFAARHKIYYKKNRDKILEQQRRAYSLGRIIQPTMYKHPSYFKSRYRRTDGPMPGMNEF